MAQELPTQPVASDPNAPIANGADLQLLLPMFTPPTEGEHISSTSTGNTYRIGHMIGEGSFGFVYACTDTWGNELAVKVLKPLGTYEEIRQNAIAELEKLRHLRHPNITYVYDAFEYRDTFYIVFERCWQSITQFIQRENFDGRVWLLAMPAGYCKPCISYIATTTCTKTFTAGTSSLQPCTMTWRRMKRFFCSSLAILE